jgi:hypothetical protein
MQLWVTTATNCQAPTHCMNISHAVIVCCDYWQYFDVDMWSVTYYINKS